MDRIAGDWVAKTTGIRDASGRDANVPQSLLALRANGQFTAAKIPASILGLDRKATVPYGVPLEIEGFSAPSRLYYFVGDPDLHQTVEFERRKPS
jgi:hypothetical protein